MKRFAASLAVILLAGCHGGDDGGQDVNTQPAFVKGAIVKTSYDGTTDDLLTAGLGKSGLQSATAPAVTDANDPAQLRRLAIYNNYRALLDVNSPNGGYGTLFGPNIDINGGNTLGEGKIAGDEWLAYSDDGSGRQNVTMMVQVPAGFDPKNPCIVTATSSGSRGVYGAIGTAGEWGLKHNCAVAYTDKGTGMGVHDLQNNTVNLINGARQDAAVASSNSNFTANLTDAQRAAFNAATPNRLAFKHAHSQQNPEKDWGAFTLQAIQFAFFVLNEKFGPLASDGVQHLRTITPANTIVIASSVSNGGGAALAAAEQDTTGLIDGVAVGEPQVQPAATPTVQVRRGGVLVSSGKSLVDYTTLGNLFQPCAALAPANSSNAAAPGITTFNAVVDSARAANRCASLKAKGLLTGATLADQANEAQAIISASGIEPETIPLQASQYEFSTPAVAVTHVTAHARASVADNLCGYSIAQVNAAGAPVPALPAGIATIFATSNGIPTGVPPGNRIGIVSNTAANGPILDGLGISPSTGVADLNLDSALCLRSLVTGIDPVTGAPLTGLLLDFANREKAGIGETLRNGNLRGKPAIIVHGRADANVPVNHSSRPYFGLNKLAEGTASKLQYYEVTNAQHFETFIDNAALPGYDSRFVPLHVYFVRALDLVFANLKSGAPLPPSQVVRTTPRGGTPGSAPAITAANVPPIAATPAAADQISVSGNTVLVPD